MARTKLRKPRRTRRKERSSQLGYEVNYKGTDERGRWKYLMQPAPDVNPAPNGLTFYRVVVNDMVNDLWHYYGIYTNDAAGALCELLNKSIPQLKGMPGSPAQSPSQSGLSISMGGVEVTRFSSHGDAVITFTGHDRNSDRHLFTVAICEPASRYQAAS